MFSLFLSYFFNFSRRWNLTRGLLRDDSGHWREETCVLLCLDVSSIFFTKLLAVILRWKVWVMWERVCGKSPDGELCMCWSQNGSGTHICKETNKGKNEKKEITLLDCTEGTNVSVLLMLKLCLVMQSCTFLSFYCKYVKENMFPGLHSSALVKKETCAMLKSL